MQALQNLLQAINHATLMEHAQLHRLTKQATSSFNEQRPRSFLGLTLRRFLGIPETEREGETTLVLVRVEFSDPFCFFGKVM